jgi:hypothetical protein
MVMFDGRELDSYEGMISAKEAELLHALSAHLAVGCIVEIGSWRGKSAIAMALGARTQPPERRPMVYCVEPHAAFVGIYGGQFGPADRKAFFEALIRADCVDGVGLINLHSASAAKAWTQPIGLLFIDGDHSVAGVDADVKAWSPFIVDGGYIAFDDALDQDIGPAPVIARLIASGAFRQTHAAGKIVVLQKMPNVVSQEIWRARSEASAVLLQRAEGAGYDGAYALARLAYGSFVSMRHKYMYVETPKVACTSWKRLIMDVEEVNFDDTQPLYHRETRREMLIHQRRYFDMPSLIDVNADARDAILAGSPDWFVFALCRNPFGRLVSVFENKVRLGEPGYQALEARFGDRAYTSTLGAFSAFVREIVTDPGFLRADAHLRPQTDLVMPRLLPCRLFKLEEVAEAVSAFTEQLRVHGYAGSVTLERNNESLGRSWRDYYDAESAELAARAYAEDFSCFGYDAQDWRGGSPFSETAEERRWRAEVVARNAMLDDVYSQLSAATSSEGR